MKISIAKLTLATAALTFAASAQAQTIVYNVDFSGSPLTHDTFVEGGAGNVYQEFGGPTNDYTLGTWTFRDFGSGGGRINGGVAQIHYQGASTYQNMWNVILDPSTFATSETDFTLTIDVANAVGGIVSVTQLGGIDGDSGVQLIQNNTTFSSNAFATTVGTDAGSVTSSQLLSSDFLSLFSTYSGDGTTGTSTFNFSYDGTGYLGLAISAFNDTLDFGGVTLSVVPEPSAYALIAGMLALGWVAVRRR